jgi:hypothetical protein
MKVCVTLMVIYLASSVSSTDSVTEDDAVLLEVEDGKWLWIISHVRGMFLCFL